jgi:crotonobetainyl-CoA:carnitine CoA-transferase CaiB-like acyl-CoA transferase
MPGVPRQLSALDPAVAGLRVADLAGAIGAYATKLLADLGADVVVVEPPGGDRLRGTPPFRDGASPPEGSLLHAYLAAGKRGVTLDVGSPEVSELLTGIGAWADVVVLSPSSRAPVEGFDFDRASLAWARDDAIVCCVTPFGLTGPYRHRRSTHFVSFAMGGGMHRMGPPEGPPVAIPERMLWETVGTHAALCILAACRARPRVGGQVVDLSVHEVAAGRDDLFDRYDVGMLTWGRHVGVGVPPTGTWACRDGLFDVACYQDAHWPAFLEMLDHPSELAEPALADMMVRQQIFDGLVPLIEELIAPRNREDLLERGQTVGLPCGLVNPPAVFVRDEQLLARDMLVRLTKPGVGSIEVPAPGFRAEPPIHCPPRAAPTLGQHTHAFYVEELDFAVEQVRDWQERGLV